MAAPIATISAASAVDCAGVCPLKKPPTPPAAMRATTVHNSTIPRGEPELLELTRASVESRITGAGISSVGDRKSTRLNSSHVSISYAVFCLKKKIERQRASEAD